MKEQKIDVEKTIRRVALKYMLSSDKNLKIFTGNIIAGDIRLNYKKRYTYINKELNQMFDNVRDIRRKRAIRVSSGVSSAKEKKMFYANHFISIKILLRKAIKNANIYKFLVNFYAAQIREAEKANDLVLLKESKMLAKKNKEDIAEIMHLIKFAGEYLTVALEKCEGLFTDHDIAQIFSCSFNKVKEAHEKYDILKKENKIQGGFLINAILNFDIENRGDYKGRHEGIQNCPSHENPFFATIILGNADKILEN